MYLIYKYTNSVNGKVYIGQTSKTLQERAQSNGNNYKESKRFHNAIKKYGWDAFVPSIIDYADTVEEANAKEIYYISEYKSTDTKYGYNISRGGDCKIMSDETKKSLSQIKQRNGIKTTRRILCTTKSIPMKLSENKESASWGRRTRCMDAPAQRSRKCAVVRRGRN